MDAHGLVVVGSEEVQDRPWSSGKVSGSYLTFKIGWTHQDEKEPENYSHRTSIFVPTDEIAKWKQLLTPGRVLLVRQARLVSRENKEGTGTFLDLKLSRTNVFPLEVALWYK